MGKEVIIKNNTVGEDASGVISGNGSNGILIGTTSTNNTIEGNTIVASGNAGISINNSNSNNIYSNQIGNVANDNPAKENGGNGIHLSNGSQQNIIGTETKGNTIKNKTGQNAIAVEGSSTITNTITGNSTSNNTGLGILLASDGNNNYGFYDGTITTGAVTFNTTEASATLISGRAPNVGDRIDVYISVDGTCQTPIAGKTPQGATWVGSTTAVANTNGNAWAQWTFTLTGGLTKDNAIVTATKVGTSTAGNTSQFAVCKSECTPPASATISPSATQFCEGTDVTLTASPSTGFVYKWFNGTTEISGQTASTLTVTATGDYKVAIGDAGNPGLCDVTSSAVTITKRDNPIFDGTASITGADLVCEGTDDVPYSLTDANSSNTAIVYDWSVSPTNAVLKGSANTNRLISFVNATEANNPFTLSITITEEHGSLTCTGGTITKTINVEANPTITFANAPVAVACNSTANTVAITNYDATNYTYTVETTSDVSNVSITAGGEVKFDASATNGSITIKAVSKTSAGCPVEASFVVSVVGCSNTVTVDNPAVCSGDELEFTANAVAGAGETITGYSWTINPAFAVVGSSTSPTIKVVAVNTTTTDLTVTATVAVVYTKSGQNVTVTSQGTATVNGNPDVAGGTIAGTSPVCENSNEIYTYSKTGFDVYTWAIASGNGTLGSGGNGLEKRGVNFTTNDNNVVKLGLSVGETRNGITCTANDVTNIDITIESTPTVTVDNANPSIECNSATNTFQITNFDTNSDYTVTQSPADMTVTVNATGQINIDAGTATTGGIIKISQKTANGCVSATTDVTMTVSLTGCGRTIDFTVDEAVVCNSGIVEFTSSVNVGGTGSIVSYEWSGITNGTVVGSTTGATLKVNTTNTTTADVTVSATLKVTFSDAPTELTTTKALVTVNGNPDVAGGSITGTSPVCENSNEVYTYSKAGFDVYTWAIASGNGTLGSGGNGAEQQGVNFSTNDNNVVQLGLSVGETRNGVTCTANDVASIDITIESTPTVTVDNATPSLQCNSATNAFQITNFVLGSTYTVTQSPTDMTVTVNQTNGAINIDAGTATTGGVIKIKQETANGCESNANDITMTVSLTGCGRTINFTTNKAVVCASETVTFTSVVDLGGTGTIVSYEWSAITNGTVIGSTSGATLQVQVANTTTADVTVSATLKVTFSDAPTELTTTKALVTVNGNPDVAGGTIAGTTPVCENSNEIYTYSKAGFDVYTWAIASGNGTLGTGGNGAEQQGVDFTTNDNNVVKLGLSVGETRNGVTCTANDVTNIDITIESTPTVTVDNATPSLECNSATNTFNITNFVLGSTYTVEQEPAGMTVTVNQTTGAINIDAGTATTGGIIKIKQVTTNGCASDDADVTMTVSLTGCGRTVNFTVNKPEVCAGEMVTLTAEVENGTPLTYAWSGVTNGTIIGSTSGPTLQVQVTNTTTTSQSLGATLTVTFADAPTSLVETKTGVVTVNPLPDLSAVTIAGATTVCYKDTEVYTIGNTTDNYIYTWTQSQGTGVAGTATNAHEVTFGGTIDFAQQVKVAVNVEDKTTGCVSLDTPEILVTVEELPVVTVAVNQMNISCQSTANEIQVTNFNSTNPSTYTIVYTGGLTGATQPDASGVIKFNGGTATTSGTVTVSEQRTTGAKCASEVSTSVAITVLGCDITITSYETMCPTAEGVTASMTFTANIADVSNVVSYKWTVTTPTGTSIITNGAPDNTLVLPAINETNANFTYEAKVEVEYQAIGLVASPDLGQTIVHRRPDHAEALVLIGDETKNNCVGDEQKYVIAPTDVTKNYSLTSDQTPIYTSVTNDTIRFENVSGGYTVTAMVSEPNGNLVCTSTISRSGLTKVVPTLGGINGKTLACVFDQTRDSVLYQVDQLADYTGVDRTWSITRNTTNVFSWTSNDKDSVAVKFGTQGDTRDYGVNDTVFVKQRYTNDGCVRVDSSYKVVKIDSAYLVTVEIESLQKLYCEDDTAKFFVDIKKSIEDPNGTFGNEWYHYSKNNWSYNTEETVAQNLRNDTATVFSNKYYYTRFNDNVADTLTYSSPIVDTSWSTTYGPFAMEDSVFYSSKPQFCYHYSSKLKDTVVLKEILQIKKDIELVVEHDGEEITSLEDVVSLPLVDVLDKFNRGGVKDAVYHYGYVLDGVDETISTNNIGLGAFYNQQVPDDLNEVTYFMILEDGGCKTRDEVTLLLDFIPKPPGGFTPNEDGEHDTFHIENMHKFPEATVQIFNRWGSLLYETTEYAENEWAGTYKGKVLPVASYYYIIDLGNGTKLLSGAISIFK